MFKMFKEKLRAFQEKQLNAHLMLGGYYPDATKSAAQQSAQEPQKRYPRKRAIRISIHQLPLLGAHRYEYSI